MSVTVRLATRAEKKNWARNLDTLYKIVAGASAFCLFLSRVLNSISAFYWSLAVFVSFACFHGIVAFIGFKYPESTYYIRKENEISISEQTILIGANEILLASLKSVIIESNGYAGKMTLGQRRPQSGIGKITVVYKGLLKEITYLIIVKSESDIKNLRQLSAIWRSKGVTAFIMD